MQVQATVPLIVMMKREADFGFNPNLSLIPKNGDFIFI